MLRLDYDALAASAKVLSREGDTFEECISVMDKEVKGLPDIWEADTCDQYVAQFQDYKKTLDKVRTLIEEMAQQMTTISKNFRDADQDMARQMR